MNLAYSVFVSLVWFLSTYFNFVFLLILIDKKSELFRDKNVNCNIANLPKVSVILPAFNEGKTIVDSINSLAKIDYPQNLLEIIVVNDGSRDDTSDKVNSLTMKNLKFIDNKVNKGKAASLNQGILASSGEFIVTMDADSECSVDILQKTIPFFNNQNVGAVTVSVEVKNPKSFLQKLIEIEYIIGLSLYLKALSYFNALHVTPGPFSIYRKSMLDKIGLFDVNNITEDMEIAFRIQKYGYKIECCASTKVFTIIPDTFKGLYKQRKRWYTGSLITLRQYKDLIFNKNVGNFGYIMPYSFILVILGLALFGFTIYLIIQNLIKMVLHFSLTNFNFWSYMSFDRFDILLFGTLSILGILSIVMTFTNSYLCMRIANKNILKNFSGFIGIPLLFFLYQYFWVTSLYAVIAGKKVKWR